MRTQHDGDCNFYASLINGRPYDGICTCGYGWDKWCCNPGDDSELMSKERRYKAESDAEHLEAATEMSKEILEEKIHWYTKRVDDEELDPDAWDSHSFVFFVRDVLLPYMIMLDAERQAQQAVVKKSGPCD